jgi:transposase
VQRDGTVTRASTFGSNREEAQRDIYPPEENRRPLIQEDGSRVNFLNLSNWRVDHVREEEDRFVVGAQPASLARLCPSCGCTSLIKQGSDAQQVRDLPAYGKHVLIRVDHPRFKCKACRKTCYLPLPDVDEQHHATSRLVSYVQQHAYFKTFRALAEEVGLDERTIRRIVREDLERRERTRVLLPTTVIGMDEFHALHQARGLIVDLERGQPIDLLVDRKQATMTKALKRLPGHEDVKIAVIDMWAPSVSSIREALPNAVIVIDRFHVVKLLHECLETVRKEVRSQLTDRQRRVLMRDRFFLLKRKKELSERELLLVESWLNTFPRLSLAYSLKEEFHDVYEAESQEEALERYFRWLDRVTPDIVDAFLPFTNAIETWGESIFAFFQNRWTAAYTESLNAQLRADTRQGRGYSWEILRARLLSGVGQHRHRKPKALRQECVGKEDIK